MKRFWKDVSIAAVENGWQVQLDGRGVKSQGTGLAQIVPSEALAEALAQEWRAQGEDIDPRGFPMRDLADYALDIVAADRDAAIAGLLRYAETDTLCFRAEPDDPLWHRQQEMWEPLVAALEESAGIALERVSGVGHRPHPPETMPRLTKQLAGFDDFTLAALTTLASLAASLCVALEVAGGARPAKDLFAAANLEEDWQAERWGMDEEAQRVRALREADFLRAATFLELARS